MSILLSNIGPVLLLVGAAIGTFAGYRSTMIATLFKRISDMELVMQRDRTECDQKLEVLQNKVNILQSDILTYRQENFTLREQLQMQEK